MIGPNHHSMGCAGLLPIVIPSVVSAANVVEGQLK